MSTEPKKDGPSKKELKKLAKKQAKEAAKNSSKDNNNNNMAPPPPSPPATLALVNPGDSSTSTTKAVWALQTFGVQYKSIVSNADGVAHGPSLQLMCDHDQQVVVMGGNSMCKAVALWSGQTTISFQVDEWCEWERSCLKNTKKRKAALDHLARALTHGDSVRHLVGHALTVADISVLCTLYNLPSESTLPSAVQDYCNCHRASYQLVLDQVAQDVKKAKSSLVSVDWNHPSLMHMLEQTFGQAIKSVFGSDVPLPKNFVGKTQNSKHGDFQCNASMPIFAALKRSNSLTPDVSAPQDVARKMIAALDSNPNSVVQQLSVQGPGFVLCRVSPAFLQDRINSTLQGGTYVLPKPAVPPATCVVDFSSPNIAKEMHVGHLRSTIIGEAVCRLLEFSGMNVKRVNHVGDWGTQFGMLIQYLREEYPEFHSSKPNITDLTQFYKSAKQRFDESADFKKASQLNVVQLQSGDAECREIWNLLCSVSRTEFQKVYNRLDITLEECGESFYNDKIPPVIDEFDSRGLVSVEEGGAKCVFCEGFPIPLMLQKSDGGFGYDSTDMAALKYRLFELRAKRIIVITDFSQGDHFKMCFAAADKIGWLTPDVQLQHIGFGTVQGEDGKRFQTRSGDTVRLVDLLDEAVSRMEAQLRERIANGKANITENEVHEVAEAIGYGAVKYFDLRRNPVSNYKFSYDQMLDTKGNTAVYLLYAHARLESICTKAKAEHGIKVEELMANGEPIVIGHESERSLVLQLQMFADVMEVTLEDLYPYHICEYLYNTAIAASDFVTQCKVLGSPEMKSRLLLCRATTTAMRQCFDLLGIRHVERI